MYIASLEDDAVQAQHIQHTLKQAGHGCTVFATGGEILSALSKAHPFELLLLDWEVPDISGLEVLRKVRAGSGDPLPVIFLTNRHQEVDLVQGLQAGADDYVIKPWQAAELLARIDAVARRYTYAPPTETPFSLGAYTIQPALGTIQLHGHDVALAPKEFDLALLLFRNPGRLFSRDALSMSVWNHEFLPTSRTLDTHLSNIRRKLQLQPEHGVRLTASYALGYRLESVTLPNRES